MFIEVVAGGAAQEDQKRLGIRAAKFAEAGLDATNGVGAQGPLAAQDGLAFDGPINNAASGIPRIGATGAMGRFRKDNGIALASNEHEAWPAGGIAEIGGDLDFEIDIIPEADQRIDKGFEEDAATAFDGALGAFIERTPVHEFADVFHEDVFDMDIGGPADELPGLGAGLFVAGTAAAGVGVEAAFAGGGEQIEMAGFDEVERVDVFNILAKVPDLGMVEGVGVDGGAPVVDGGELVGAAEAFGDGFDDAGGGTAGAAKEIDCVNHVLPS